MLSLYSENGSLGNEETLELSGNSLNRYDPANNPLKTDLDKGLIMIDAGEAEIEGTVRWTRDGSGGADSMFALNAFGTSFFASHVARTVLWHNEIVLINVSGRENLLSLSLVNGAETYNTTFALLPFEKRTVEVNSLFPALDMEVLNSSALEISSQADMTGCFFHKIRSASACYALIPEGEAGQELMLPHVASNDYWWTGAAIFNPRQAAVQVERNSPCRRNPRSCDSWTHKKKFHGPSFFRITDCRTNRLDKDSVKR